MTSPSRSIDLAQTGDVTRQHGDEECLQRCVCGHRFEIHRANQRYCSAACKDRAYNQRNPVARQRALPLSPAAPAIGTPAHVEQRQALNKRQTKKARLLALLRKGSALTWDMMMAGGSGWRSRLQELREDGYTVRTEEHPDYAIYRLVGEP